MQVGDRYLDAQKHKPRARRAGTLVLAIGAHVAVITTVIVAGYWHVDEMPTPPHTNLTVLIATPPPAPAAPATASTPSIKPHRGGELVAPQVVKKLSDVTPSETPQPETPEVGTGGAGGAGGEGGGGGGGGAGGTGTCTVNCGPGPAGPAQLVTPEVGKARLIGGAMPRYSERARAAGVEGTIAAKICVTPQSGISSVTLLRGLPLLDETVLNAVRNWRYKPFTVGDKALPFCYVANFEFHLQGR